MQIEVEQARRLSVSLETLGERIARLAIGLGIKLNDQQAVQQVIDQAPPRGRGASGRTAQAMSGGRRVVLLREELRGLLVLRYQLETVSLNQHGLELTREIVSLAEYRLEQRGFRPGANGPDADGLFNEH